MATPAAAETAQQLALLPPPAPPVLREVPDFPPATEGVQTQLPQTELEVVDLKVRNDRLWKAVNLLGRMSRQEGLTKAQFNEQIAQDLQDDIGVGRLAAFNAGITSGAGSISEEGPRDRRLRTLFSQGTGYETSNPFDKGPKTPEQDLGNLAFGKFRKTYEGPGQAKKARAQLRKHLKQTAQTFKFPDQTGK